MRASANFTAVELDVELHYGRLRRAYIAAVLAAAVAAGWLWLGNAGAALLALWVWSSHWQDWRGGVRPLTIALDDLRYARLGAHRLLLVRGLVQATDIFSDELEPAEYARVRRELKAWFRAADSRRLTG